MGQATDRSTLKCIHFIGLASMPPVCRIPLHHSNFIDCVRAFAFHSIAVAHITCVFYVVCEVWLGKYDLCSSLCVCSFQRVVWYGIAFYSVGATQENIKFKMKRAPLNSVPEGLPSSPISTRVCPFLWQWLHTHIHIILYIQYDQANNQTNKQTNVTV